MSKYEKEEILLDENIIDEQKVVGETAVFELPPIHRVAEFASITFHNVCPEHDVGAYLSSKVHTGEQRGEPNPDCVPGIGTELVSRKRLLQRAEDRLQKIRLISKGRKIDLKKEWKIVINMQEQLRDSVISFENFIKENMEKRERADRKIHDELAIQSTRRDNIQLLAYEMQRLLEVKKIFESNIRIFRIYENYLQKVVAISEYKDVHKIMQRFSALQEAKDTAFHRSQRIMHLIEESIGTLRHKSEENELLIIGLENKVRELQTRFGEAEQNALMWETTVTAVREQCLTGYRNHNIVKQVSKRLYELMCRRKGLTGRNTGTFQRWDSEQENQMIIISKTLQQMEKIIGMVKDGPKGNHVKTWSYTAISNAISINQHQ